MTTQNTEQPTEGNQMDALIKALEPDHHGHLVGGSLVIFKNDGHVPVGALAPSRVDGSIGLRLILADGLSEDDAKVVQAISDKAAPVYAGILGIGEVEAVPEGMLAPVTDAWLAQNREALAPTLGEYHPHATEDDGIVIFDDSHTAIGRVVETPEGDLGVEVRRDVGLSEEQRNAAADIIKNFAVKVADLLGYDEVETTDCRESAAA